MFIHRIFIQHLKTKRDSFVIISSESKHSILYISQFPWPYLQHCTFRLFPVFLSCKFYCSYRFWGCIPSSIFCIIFPTRVPTEWDCEGWSFWSRICTLICTLVLSILTLTGIMLDCPRLAAAVTALHVSGPGFCLINTGRRSPATYLGRDGAACSEVGFSLFPGPSFDV